MKLVFAVIQNDDVKSLTRALVDKSFGVTRISSSGGFLRGGNTTMMIGVEEERLEELLSIIKETTGRRHAMTVSSFSTISGPEINAMPLEVLVGGATVFVTDVDRFIKF